MRWMIFGGSCCAEYGEFRGLTTDWTHFEKSAPLQSPRREVCAVRPHARTACRQAKARELPVSMLGSRGGAFVPVDNQKTARAFKVNSASAPQRQHLYFYTWLCIHQGLTLNGCK